MTIFLIVHITVQPGKAAEQLAAFQRLAPLVRAEAGCLEYRLHRVEGDDDQFVLTEQWASEAALAAHDAAPHMVAASQANKAFRAGPARVYRLRGVDA
ncbi:MAG: antibiotic biosynthesis monooxygenase [Burkholderiales bacterium]|nr:antibiotic biosynthesis monooxygenase [Burkholderiales bacterium]